MMRRVHPLVATFAAAAVAAPCAAQRVNDGRALDRNLQTGSGGVNPRIRSVEETIRFNNAVVTGNAPMGRSFRGDVGYLAADDFREATGSNDLFEFRRDALYSGAVAAGIRGTDALRYQFSLVTGQAPPSILGASPLLVDRAGAGASGRSVSDAIRSTAGFYAEQQLTPSLIGYRTGGEGPPMAITASPLLGVRYVGVPVVGSGPAAAPQAPGQPGAAPDPAASVRPGRTLSGLESAPFGVVDSMTLAGRSRVNQPADLRIEPRSAAHRRVLDVLIRELGDAAAEPAEPAGAQPTPAPGIDERLRQLREQLDAAEEAQTPDGEAGDQPPGSRLDRDLLRAIENAPTNVETLGPAQGGEGAAEQDAMYRSLMQSGQELLSRSRYFDAEDVFTRALASTPRDPMASIGRIHAQIGAGLYRSAAANLRAFLRRHPELARARYREPLFPAGDRRDRIVEQLRPQLDVGTGLGVDAALLTAYVGYQAQDEAVLKRGMDRLRAAVDEADPGERALLELITALWKIEPEAPPE